MILHRISLAPFAGLQKEFSFTPGLNVVLGPNDVGKSTLFRAVDSVFFLPVKLRASTVEGKNLPRLIPLGGDHAKVKIEFGLGEKKYSLEKRWGANFSCELKLPDGNILSSPEAVDQRLSELLPVPAATFQSVLLTSQNALERTKEEFAQKPEALHSLGDALRRATELTGGVSVEKFKAELESRLTAQLENWDMQAGGPKGGRGIENKWQKGRGNVLRAYYAKEELKKDLARANALETELDEKLKVLAARQAERAERQDFVTKNRDLVESVAARKTLELQLGQAEKEVETLTREFSRWVQADADRKILKEEVERLEKKREGAEAEMKLARAGMERKALAARFEKIEEARRRWLEKQQSFSALPALKAEDLKKIHTLSASLNLAKAGKLRLQFIAKSKMDLSVQKNFDPPRRGVIEAGASMSIQSGSRIQIQNELFELTVVSGDEKALEAETAALNSLLTGLGVASAEEAQERSERWSLAGGALREAEGIYKALLGRDDYEQLRQKIESGGSVPARDAESVEKEFRELSLQYSEKKAAFTAAGRVLEELSARYSVSKSEELTKLMLRQSTEAEKARARLQQLPALPSEMGDTEAYLAKYRRYQNELLPLTEEVRILSNTVAELKARMPEQSAQDFDRQHREAQSVFESELKRARALFKVKEAAEKIESEAGDIYREFRAGFDHYVNELSFGKYGKAGMEAALPAHFLRKDGAEIPFEWLSAGTKDAFALALRLSMAKHFLKGNDGFVMMDDPMVAMDPERQKAAAGLLRSFADGVQMILFTCHPSHAELLGGSRISF